MPDLLDFLKTSIIYIVTQLGIQLRLPVGNSIGPEDPGFFQKMIDIIKIFTKQFLNEHQGNNNSWVYPALYAFLQVKYNKKDKGISGHNTQTHLIPKELQKLHISFQNFFQDNFTISLPITNNIIISHAQRLFYALVAIIMILLIKKPDPANIILNTNQRNPTFLDIIGVGHDAREPTKPEQMSFVEFLILSIDQRNGAVNERCFKLALELVYEMREKHDRAIGIQPPALNASSKQSQQEIESHLDYLFDRKLTAGLYRLVNDFRTPINITIKQPKKSPKNPKGLVKRLPKNSQVFPSINDLADLNELSNLLSQDQEPFYCIGGALQLFDLENDQIPRVMCAGPAIWADWLMENYPTTNKQLNMNEIFTEHLNHIVNLYPQDIGQMTLNIGQYNFPQNPKARIKLIFTMEGMNKKHERNHWIYYLSLISETYNKDLYCPLCSTFNTNYDSRYFVLV